MIRVGSSSSTVSTSISAAGGVVADGVGAMVSLPAESLMSVKANVKVSSRVSESSVLPLAVLGTATAVSRTYTLAQDSGLNFTSPVSVTLPYVNTGLKSNDKLAAAYFDHGLEKWVPISNGVDNRIAGSFTFETMHFSEWAIVKLIRSSTLPQNFDKGFNPQNDGIPIINFGAAVTPDGSTSYEDGSCAGMVGLAGWYWQFMRISDGSAATRFGDNLETRTFVAMLHSRWRMATGNLPVLNNLATWVEWPTAAEKIKEKLYFNQAPVIAWVEFLDDQGVSKSHYVLIYKYDSNGRFYFYDPNVPYVEKYFDTSAIGSITGWTVLDKSVKSFRLYESIGEFITLPDLVEMYSKFKMGSEYPSWGKVTATGEIKTNATNKLLRINGTVSTVTNLAGKPLYVHYFASKSDLINPKSGVEPLQQIRAIENLNLANFGITVGPFVGGGNASFGATFDPLLFKQKKSGIALRLIVSTNAINYFEGQWAYGEVSFSNLSPESVCTSPQILTNGACITSAISITPTAATANTPTTFTITGQNLPLTAVMSLAEGNCQTPTARTATGFTVVCTPGNTTGSKLATISTAATGGTVIDASKTITVSATPNAPTINVSSQAPTVFDSVSFWLSDAYQSIKTVVWNFGNGAADLVATVANGVSTAVNQVFDTSGSKTVTATYKDNSGNTLESVQTNVQVQQGVIQKTAAIAAVKTEASVLIPAGTTVASTKPIISGNISAALTNTEVVLVYDGTVLLGRGTVTATSWTYSATTSLVAGVHNFTAAVARADGLEGTPSAAYVVTISGAVSSSSVTAISPQTATVSTATTFTITAQNLPLTAVMALAEGTCLTPTARTATGFTVVCTPGSTAGSKLATISTTTGGAVIDASRSVTVSAVPVALLPGTFTSTGSMSTPRLGHTATLLSNGKVLIIGGDNSANTAPYLATAELYDSATGAFSLTGSMSTGRSGHTATLLSSGKVLVTGGMDVYATNHALTTAEIYDPATGLFTATGALLGKRYWHTASLLPSAALYPQLFSS